MCAQVESADAHAQYGKTDRWRRLECKNCAHPTRERDATNRNNWNDPSGRPLPQLSSLPSPGDQVTMAHTHTHTDERRPRRRPRAGCKQRWTSLKRMPKSQRWSPLRKRSELFPRMSTTGRSARARVGGQKLLEAVLPLRRIIPRPPLFVAASAVREPLTAGSPLLAPPHFAGSTWRAALPP